MVNWQRLHSTLILIAFAFGLMVTPSLADPKGKTEHPGAKGKKVRGELVDYTGGGPPPWAPAHGYRRKRGRGPAESPGAFVVPHSIEVGRCNRGTLGAVLGGVAGGVLGSKVGDGAGKDAAVVAGTVLGAVVGGRIGRWMDEIDQACAAQTLEYSGTEKGVEWVNPDNGTVYEVTPTETYQTDSGRYCREYRATADVGGTVQEVYGTACRQPDGTWQLVNF